MRAAARERQAPVEGPAPPLAWPVVHSAAEPPLLPISPHSGHPDQNGCGILRMKTEADELSMPDAFRQFHLDCEGKQSIKQLCLSRKMAVSELTVWYLFAALLQ